MRSLFVGSLNYDAEDQDLVDLFSEVGPVKQARVIRDRDTGRSKGFAFVDMETEDGTDEAIQRFHEAQFQGRQIVVNMARERSSAPKSSYGSRY